jgi:hypothetical protein
MGASTIAGHVPVQIPLWIAGVYLHLTAALVIPYLYDLDS